MYVQPRAAVERPESRPRVFRTKAIWATGARLSPRGAQLRDDEQTRSPADSHPMDVSNNRQVIVIVQLLLLLVVVVMMMMMQLLMLYGSGLVARRTTA